MGFIEGSLAGSELSAKITRFVSSLIGVVLCVLLVFGVSADFKMGRSSLTTLLKATNIAVNLTLRNKLTGLTKNVVLLLFGPFRMKSCVVIGKRSKDRKAMTGIRVYCAALLSVSGGRVIVPGNALSGIAVAGMATESRQELRVGIKVSCGTSVRGTGSVLRSVLARSPSAERSRRVIMFMSRLTRDSIVVNFHI